MLQKPTGQEQGHVALPGQQGHIGPKVNDLNWSCILFKYDSEQEEDKNFDSGQSYNYLNYDNYDNPCDSGSMSKLSTFF